ncbi:hypothetical protein Drose_34915 [Dactylosporangium roseum]|uniref:Uncharacterized protein n=1 Tax=Dactylosporangium roseum TaxID=47989 RepID=A0ABY5Z5U8_9ACTN|nr:hypothetical protein [Dactylosporangium roseum]UWZ36192.1 hypothetical protein Drose_34915 [Dactylosporangium roseum]
MLHWLTAARAAVRAWPRRQQIIAGSAMLTVLAVLATWLLWPQDPPPPAPRERQYKATTACLLTDDQDLAAEPARTVWAGMQDASVQTLVKVQHLAISGPQTTANGLTYYNTLGMQRCTVIIAAGPVPVAAMTEGITAFPDIKHYAVGGNTDGKPVTTIDTTTADTIKTGARAAVTAAG